MSLQGFNSGPLTYLAGAPIATNLLATLTSTAGTAGLCGASGVPCGVADGPIASGAYGNFMPMRGRIQVVSAGSVTAGDFVKAAANGQVAPEAGVTTRTAATLGIAETAGETQTNIFWMVCL